MKSVQLLSQELQRLRSEVNAKQSSLMQKKLSLQTQEKTLEPLKKEIELREKSIAQKEDDIKKIQIEVEKIKDGLSKVDAAKKKLTDDSWSKQTSPERKKHEQIVKEKEAEIQKKKAELMKLENEIKRLTIIIDAEKGNLMRFDSEAKAKSDKAEKIGSSSGRTADERNISTKTAKIKLLQTEIERIKNEIKQRTARMNDLSIKSGNLKAAVALAERDTQNKKLELTRIENEYRTAVQGSAIKNRI